MSYVVDVGCGRGESSLPGWVGVDGDPRVLTEAANRGLRPVLADIEKPWPFADQSLRGVVLFDVLEHLADPLLPLMEAARVLQESGRLLVALPNAAHLVNRVGGLCGKTSDFTDAAHRRNLPISDHLHRFSASSAHRLLTDAGYRVVDRVDYFPDRFEEGRWVALSPLARLLAASRAVGLLPTLLAYEFAFMCEREQE